MSVMKKRNKGEWLRDNQVYVLAFLVPFLTMLAIFAAARIYPFGDRSFLHIDMYHQYFPFLVDFYHAIKGTGEGSGLLYSWNAGLGSNFVALYTYYLASPLNWLCVLVPEMALMEFMSYFVIVKIGACGFTCAYYLSKHFNTKSMSVVFFGIFYAMSGYMAAYNWDVMWLDPIMLFPLVLLGLEKLVKDGDFRLYTITLGISILSNYYICISMCIFLCIYYFALLLPVAQKKIVCTVRFAVTSMLGGAMAAVLLLPEVLALRLSKFSSADFPSTFKTYFSILDILARHLMDVTVETGLDHWPNIYCSVAVFALIPLYIICDKINLREKITKLVILVFFLISFSSNVLTFIWHGFNYPDSLPCRQSYLYIFLVIVMCYEAYLHIKEYSSQTMWIVLAIALGFMLLSQKLVTDDAITDRTYLLSALAICVYAFLVFMYRHGNGVKEHLIYAVVLAVVLEAGANTMLTSVPTVSRTKYLTDYRAYNNMYNDVNELEDGKLYRFEKNPRITKNDGMLHNYMSTSIFSSTSNGLVSAFYKNYGLRTSKVFYCNDCAVPFIDSLLSNKYIFTKTDTDEKDYMTQVSANDDIALYAYNNAVPYGYMITDSSADVARLIEDEETAFRIISGDEPDEDASLNPVERQNELAYKLGATGELYTFIDEQWDGSEATVMMPYSAYVVGYMDTKKVKTLNAVTSEGEKTIKELKNPYIFDLGYNYANESIYLDGEEDADLHLKLYAFNTDVYEQITQKLAESTMHIDSFKSTKLTGTIEAKEDGYLVFSTPFDPGWSVYVDGKKAEVNLFEEMMMTVRLSAGNHTIEMKYMPQGLIVGAVLSIVAIGALVCVCVLYKRKKN